MEQHVVGGEVIPVDDNYRSECSCAGVAKNNESSSELSIIR
jgi:hypothetical protein